MSAAPSVPPAIPSACRELLERHGVGVLATIRPDGQLSVNPVSPMFDGETVRVSARSDRRKVRNLRADPRVALCVVDPDDTGRYVELRGRADVADDVDRVFVRAMTKRHMGLDDYPWDGPDDHRSVITIHLEQLACPDHMR